MGINIPGISVEYSLCGPEKWIVDRGPIYAERLFGAATKNTDKTLFLVLRFSKATTPFVVFIFLFLWSGLFCCVLVPGTLAFHLLYLDELRLFGLLCLTVCDHRNCISLGWRISTGTGCVLMSLGRERPPSKTTNARTKAFNREIRYRKSTTQQSYGNRPTLWGVTMKKVWWDEIRSQFGNYANLEINVFQ